MKHVHQACTLRHQSLRCMDDEEESMVIRKLSSKSNTDCGQTVDSPDKPSDGVPDIKGVQGDQVSWGGSIQEMGDDIDNHGNMSDYQHNHPLACKASIWIHFSNTSCRPLPLEVFSHPRMITHCLAIVRATPSYILKQASCGLYKNSGSSEMRLMG